MHLALTPLPPSVSILWLSVCLFAYALFWFEFSQQARRQVLCGVVVACACAVGLSAFDMAIDCDWDTILGMFGGWQVPAWYYWFQMGCA
jgi:hypothetical protein